MPPPKMIYQNKREQTSTQKGQPRLRNARRETTGFASAALTSSCMHLSRQSSEMVLTREEKYGKFIVSSD